MDFSLYWLLALPVFFGLGWLAARFDLKELLQESRRLPEAYFKGLNFLLNEKQDEALDVLAEALRDHEGATDLQFALGGLFRRRGDIDRATRIHQTLLNQIHLSEADRLKALFELGQDYQKAGLFDRAEELFLKLSETDYAIPSALFLKEIYLAEKEWARAVAVLDELIKKRTDPRDQLERAHFLCEWALNDYHNGHEADARTRVQRALSDNPASIRAVLLLAEWDRAAGRYSDAIQRYEEVAFKDPALLFLAAPGLIAASEAMGNTADALIRLRAWVRLCPSIDLVREVYETLSASLGHEEALSWCEATLMEFPSLATLGQFVAAKTREHADETVPDAKIWRVAHQVIAEHLRVEAIYVCEHCGFRAKKFHWHCPACATWESLPIRRAPKGISQ